MSDVLERDVLFKKLRAKPDNKVGCYGRHNWGHSTIGSCCSLTSLPCYRSLVRAGLLRLPRKKSHMVVRPIWRVHLPRLRRHPPEPRRSRQLRQASSSLAGFSHVLGGVDPHHSHTQGLSLLSALLRRSTTLDTWTYEQLKVRRWGANLSGWPLLRAAS